MRKSFAVIAVCVTLAVLSGVAAAARAHFRAHGTADQEVQAVPVESRAQAQATFKLANDGESLRYKLNVAQLEDVLFAHIHLAPAGSNGPVVAFLAGPFIPPLDRANGRLARGAITAGDLVGPLAGQPLADLINAMEDHNTYINVHTSQYPDGEVRGQIQT
jgi:Cu/Zn superoxide dismutase